MPYDTAFIAAETGDKALHQRTPEGAIILRSSFVATIIMLLFVFVLGVPPGAPEQLPPPSAAEQSPQSPQPSEAHLPSGSTSSAPGSDAALPAGDGSSSASGSEKVTATAVLTGRTVVLDAGHGGTDPGAIGVSGRAWEKYNTLFVALDAKTMLERAGARVIMTRSDDRFVPLATRAAMANQAGADVFISIHNDSNPNPSIRGVSTYFYHERSRRLANVMQANLVTTLGARNVGVFQRSFHVLRETTIPSVLVELGFLSNWYDEQLLIDAGYRYRAAQAIYDGVVHYFTDA